MVEEPSNIPASLITSHGGPSDPRAAALGLDVDMEGMGPAPKMAAGPAVLVFDQDNSTFVGVCLMRDDIVVRLGGRVMQSVDCSDDCCSRALVRVRFQVCHGQTFLPHVSIIANSTLSLGDYCNWQSPVCSFNTETVLVEATAHRNQVLAQHFRWLKIHDAFAAITTVCVGVMKLHAQGLENQPTSFSPSAVVSSLLSNRTQCSWDADEEWLCIGRHANRRGSAS